LHLDDQAGEICCVAHEPELAAINTGVPAQAFTPVSILDLGPDGIPGSVE